MRKRPLIILLSALLCLCCGFVSTNVRLGNFSYDAIDKLVCWGLIDSAMLTTKPFSRLEMARLIAEATEKTRQLNEKNELIFAILGRLQEEFKAELTTTGVLDGEFAESFIKPIEDPYIRYAFADERPDLENQRGDIFSKHSKYRLGFASRMQFFDTTAFYLHPEYVDCSSDGDSDIELIEGYGKLTLGNLEVEVGKDSLWWGPGRHGSMLMTNNTEPFKMIKISNPDPVQLPWVFGAFGPFKAVWFLTELEEDRVIPEAKLTGLRFNFKPHPAFELGLSRAIMFGGSGVPSVGLKEYLKMWRPQAEQAENNQLAGFDVSVLIPFDNSPTKSGLIRSRPSAWPAKSIKLYTDFAGEDEASGMPAKWGKLFGMQLNDILRTGRTDLLIEYANNHVSSKPNVFYTHSLYGSGYTYKGRIIGHHMGTDARDFLLRLSHYLTENLVLGVEFDREVKNLSSKPRQTTDQMGFDLTFFTKGPWQFRTDYRYEHSENSSFVSGDTQNNHIFQLELIYRF